MSTTYSMVSTRTSATTGTGLDQLVDAIYADNSLAGNNSAVDINAGADAANRLNAIIIEAAQATGAAADGVFTNAEVVAMNAWIRANRLTEWTALHGDDETDSETGYHRVQNDGADQPYRGQNLLNTVIDGVYHMGFEIQNGTFLNEDGNANATVDQVAGWLTQFWKDRSTTGTGLDRIVSLIQADGGLAANTSQADIAAGQDAANALNQLIKDGIDATGALADHRIDAADVTAINAWIRSDTTRYNLFVTLHGDDETGAETGYHLVQNDGSSTNYFGRNLVNTVADGIYHIGFEIQNGTLLNEDGNPNATVTDVASWINYFYVDQSTTGTGLDKIVDIIKTDAGLAANTSAADINAGADYADQFNHLLLDAISATGALNDGWITPEDVRAMNAWVRADPARYAHFVELHGDDETGSETGYHLVQNDGANTNYFGQNLVNTVADGLYHFGFEIQGNNVLNEDGNQNASLNDMGNWLNYFVKSSTWINGTGASETLGGGADGEEIVARDGNDLVLAGAGNDLIWGGWGNDTLQGEAGDDILYGGVGDDTLDGGAGSDSYRVGITSVYGFQGYDTYTDSGTSGTDTLKAEGAGDVDIGLTGWSAATGIETIDATSATGTVRLAADGNNSVLDFRTTTLLGANLVIDGGWGNDTIYGSAAADVIVGNVGDDRLDGGAGADIYRTSGIGYSFQGFDTYADSGSSGTDVLQAVGTGDIDIGLTGWSAASGIERVDATGVTGTVRLAADGNNSVLDFRTTTLLGTNLVIDGGWGNDTILGSAAADVIVGNVGDDSLDGGAGADTYRVTGNAAIGMMGYDTYADTGTSGTDRIVALGTGDVDVGLSRWSSATGIEVIDASGATGTVRLLGDGGNNTMDFRSTTLTGSNIVLDGGWGNDTIYGSTVADTLVGGIGDDSLDGSSGADTYRVSGNGASGFMGYDTYADSGTSGTDTLKALGTGDVDIGLTRWSSASGIEVIDATGATGTVRLIGDGNSNTLDFRTTKLTGTNIVLDGGWGNDTILGSTAADTLVGGIGDDSLDGGAGADTYRVTNVSGFQGYDTYADTGTSGTDTLKAEGTGDVDIGLSRWSSATGIEVINTTGATGTVRLLGDGGNNTLDFRATTLTGSNIVIDGGWGNDTLYGSAAANVLVGGVGDDSLDGGGGADTYNITGNAATGMMGYDTYADTGTSGTDTLKAIGTGDVDIGLTRWSGTTGIEVINATGAAGTVRLLGDGGNNVLDFRATTLTGSNIVIDGGWGNDTIIGSAAANVLVGGIGDDSLDGGLGADTYRVTGNSAAGFMGYDTYADTGTTGTDTLQALGTGDVDVGLVRWSSTTGIEVINTTGVTGTARLIGDGGNNTLDFRSTTLTGSNIVLDGGWGNDTIYGNAAANVLMGNIGDDWLDGGLGADTYRITNIYGFQGYDTYADSGTIGTDRIQAQGTVRLLGDGNNNLMDFRATTLTGTNIVLEGGWGNDTIYGSAAADILMCGVGDDRLDGAGGSDTYRVTGNASVGMMGYDTFADSGTSGTDTLKAIGTDVDIGLSNWSSTTGIETIDATGATGTVRLLGDGNNNTMDFRATTLTGSNIVIDGGWGNDTVYGSAGADTLASSIGDDVLDGSSGSDTYRVSGNGSSGFTGYDTYADSGTSGTDTLKAIGTGDVDVGLTRWSSATGIETIDASGATGTVRLLGDGGNTVLDFRTTTLTGSNLMIDSGWGNDTVYGSTAADAIAGNVGDDWIDGGLGNDTLSGGYGNDAYQAARGGGADRITETDGSDSLTFASGVAIEQLWFRRVGSDLEVSIIGSGDSVTIGNWYGGSASHVEQIKTIDGNHTLLDTQVDALVTAMAGFAAPTAGQTTLPTSYQTALAPVIATSWS